MNREEYESMITDMVEALTEAIFAAAERNKYKDKKIYAYRLPNNQGPIYDYVKGWEGFDLRPKLLEEFKEVVEKPSVREIGDLAWVLAMMLDQLRSKPISQFKQNIEEATKP